MFKTKKTFFWDFDKVFISDDDNYSHYFEAAKDIANILKINISLEELIHRWYKSWETGKNYEMNIDVLVNEFGKDYQLCHLLIHKLLIRNHTNAYSINTKLAEEILRLVNHTNIIVTHASKEWVMYWLNQLGLDDFFDDIICIKNLNLCKHSNPETYPYILNKHNLLAEECFMIDDSERNLPLAANVGIKPILYSEKKSTLGYETHSCPIKLIDSLAA